MKKLSVKELAVVVGGNKTTDEQETKEENNNKYIAYAMAKTTRR